MSDDGWEKISSVFAAGPSWIICPSRRSPRMQKPPSASTAWALEDGQIVVHHGDDLVVTATRATMLGHNRVAT